MEYSRIVAVTAMPGLYEIINSKTDGAIVRSLDDGSTKFVSSRVHNLTHLESIEIYTTGENVSLSEVLSAMKNSGSPLPDVKDNKALKQYFEKSFPQLDFDRVYASDMKKMVNWLKALDQHNIDFTIKETNDEEASEKNAGENAADKNEKEVLEVTADTAPEATKTKTRKKKTKEENGK